MNCPQYLRAKRWDNEKPTHLMRKTKNKGKIKWKYFKNHSESNLKFKKQLTNVETKKKVKVILVSKIMSYDHTWINLAGYKFWRHLLCALTIFLILLTMTRTNVALGKGNESQDILKRKCPHYSGSCHNFLSLEPHKHALHDNLHVLPTTALFSWLISHLGKSRCACEFLGLPEPVQIPSESISE